MNNVQVNINHNTPHKVAVWIVGKILYIEFGYYGFQVRKSNAQLDTNNNIPPHIMAAVDGW